MQYNRTVYSNDTLTVATMSTTSSKRILIIDDEAIIREVVQSCLEELAGWEVVTAKSGQEGLIKADREKPDAIVLDMMMPEMDGLLFLDRLRANSQTRSIPVFLVTVREEFTDRRWMNKLNLAGVLAKPFDPFQLIEQIAAVLGQTDEG
jgi:CheY-like chemotaxis protein